MSRSTIQLRVSAEEKQRLQDIARSREMTLTELLLSGVDTLAPGISLGPPPPGHYWHVRQLGADTAAELRTLGQSDESR